MSSYLKPQSPLKDVYSGDYIYPLTTMDQVLLEDGSRMSGLKFISVDMNDYEEGEASPSNADTLGGKYESDLSVLNSEKLGGIDASQYIRRDEAGILVTKNYSVVGGPNQPENPTENMIWVQTETEEIGKVYFSGINPSNCTDNDIWIFTSSNSSTVAFDSIRIGNDTVQTIYPISAKQYIDGAWVDKIAKSYQNNEWVEWIVYLFDYSKQQFQWKTGTRKPNNTSYAGVAPTVQILVDGSVKLTYDKPSNQANSGTFEMEEPYDLTGKKEITIYYNSATTLTGNSNPFRLVLFKSDTGYDERYATIDLTHIDNKVTLPISGIGLCYIGILAETNGWETSEPSSKSIIIEKIENR